MFSSAAVAGLNIIPTDQSACTRLTHYLLRNARGEFLHITVTVIAPLKPEPTDISIGSTKAIIVTSQYNAVDLLHLPALHRSLKLSVEPSQREKHCAVKSNACSWLSCVELISVSIPPKQIRKCLLISSCTTVAGLNPCPHYLSPEKKRKPHNSSKPYDNADLSGWPSPDLDNRLRRKIRQVLARPHPLNQILI